MAGQIQGSAWPSLHTRPSRSNGRPIPTAIIHIQASCPGTLATEFRDFGDRDSGQLGVILGTLATKLIGDTNNVLLASVGRVPVAFERNTEKIGGHG